MVMWGAYVITVSILMMMTGSIAFSLVMPFFLFFLFWPVVFLVDVIVTIFQQIFRK